MNKQFIILWVLLTSLTHLASTHATGCIVGKIQFPSTVNQIPSMRVYYCGKKIDFHWCEVDNSAKQFSYQIPYQIGQTKFYVLIVDHPDWVPVMSKYMEENNTIDYLTIPPHVTYKRYACHIVPNKDNKGGTHWEIAEEKLSNNDRQITDVATTIIICYQPYLVEKVMGSSMLELPTVVLKDDLLQLVGSEKQLHDLSNQILLACINSDTIHATVEQRVKQVNHVNIVAPVS